MVAPEPKKSTSTGIMVDNGTTIKILLGALNALLILIIAVLGYLSKETITDMKNLRDTLVKVELKMTKLEVSFQEYRTTTEKKLDKIESKVNGS